MGGTSSTRGGGSSGGGGGGGGGAEDAAKTNSNTNSNNPMLLSVRTTNRERDRENCAGFFPNCFQIVSKFDLKWLNIQFVFIHLNV